MYFKRHEAYRYTFAKPVAGQLRSSSDTKGRIDVDVLDVSREGARLYCRHAVNLYKNAAISLSFQLNETIFQAEGCIVWIKTYPRSATLGVFLNTDQNYKESITQVLKQIAKQKKRDE